MLSSALGWLDLGHCVYFCMLHYKRDIIKTMYPDNGNQDDVYKLSQVKNV